MAGYKEAVEAVRYLKRQWRTRPRVGVVLGSGLADVVRRVLVQQRVSYRRIPHFPRPTVLGHEGVLYAGYWGRVPVAVLEGRMHYYEGYTPAEVAFPTRVLALWGIKTLVLTCAAGGVSPQAAPGTFMVFRDHLNFQGMNPLVGVHDRRWGERFVDLSQAYDLELRRQIRKAARSVDVKCFEGVYASVLGPTYETPAEIQALKRLGADAVGMSTVPEVLAARQKGLRVLAVATITNRAAGLSRRPLSHEGVLAIGKEAAEGLSRLLEAIIPTLDGNG